MSRGSQAMTLKRDQNRNTHLHFLNFPSFQPTGSYNEETVGVPEAPSNALFRLLKIQNIGILASSALHFIRMNASSSKCKLNKN